MADRFDLAILQGCVADFLAALLPLALSSDALATLHERAGAAIRATDDPVAQIEILAALCRDLSAAGADDPSEWLSAMARVQAIPAPSRSPAVTRAQGLSRAASALIEAACLQEAAVSAVASPPAIRDEATDLRARLIAASAPTLDRLASLCGLDAHAAVSRCIDLAVEGIDRAVIDIAPLALIRTERRLPSCVAAWLLYGDPERAGELVARAGTTTPLMLPKEFLAVAPAP